MTATFTLSADAVRAVAEEVAKILAASRPDDPEPWLNADGVAEYLACNRRRIYDLASQGRIPFVRDGRRMLFRRSEIDESLGLT